MHAEGARVTCFCVSVLLCAVLGGAAAQRLPGEAAPRLIEHRR
jgi:hypothetical protein